MRVCFMDLFLACRALARVRRHAKLSRRGRALRLLRWRTSIAAPVSCRARLCENPEFWHLRWSKALILCRPVSEKSSFHTVWRLVRPAILPLPYPLPAGTTLTLAERSIAWAARGRRRFGATRGGDPIPPVPG